MMLKFVRHKCLKHTNLGKKKFLWVIKDRLQPVKLYTLLAEAVI